MLNRLLSAISVWFLVFASPAMAQKELALIMSMDAETDLVNYRGDPTWYLINQSGQVTDRLSTPLFKTHHFQARNCGTQELHYPNMMAYFPVTTKAERRGGSESYFQNDMVLKRPTKAWTVENGRFVEFSNPQVVFCYPRFY